MAVPIPFGRYVLLDKLAVGGMAELFLAKVVGEAGFEKTCVIKRLLPHLSVHEDFVAMFLDEARLAARLDHPGIVQVFDLGHAQDDYFLAMEYLAGEDLASVLRRTHALGRQVPVDVAVRVIARAAEALHFAHELKGPKGAPLDLVHRDVSPSNLFITYQGAVKLLDFGIARAASQLRQTQAGQIKGKAPYMSPEQISGRAVDRRTDLWALGVCLHELLTGRRLFTGGSKHAVISAVLEGPIPAPGALRPGLPSALSEVVQRALMRDPAARFQTAADFRAALERSGLLGTEPQVSLGDYLSELFGGARAEIQLRRASAWTGSVSSGQGAGTERLGPASSERPASVATVSLGAGAVKPAVTEREEALPTVSLRPAASAPVAEDPEVMPRGGARGRRVALGLGAMVAVVAAVVGTRLWWSSARAGASGAQQRSSASSSAPAEQQGSLSPSAASPGQGPSPVPSSALAEQWSSPTEQRPSSELPSAHLAAPSDSVLPATAPSSDTSDPSVASTTTLTEPHRPTAHRRAPSAARLSVTANLPAVGYLDGHRLGTLPLTRVKVPPGNHRLRVVAVGLGAAREERLVLAAGAAQSREVRFAKGKLNIDAEPWADVWVDGARMGQTPLAGREVWEGKHQVRLQGPGGSKTLEIRVHAGQTAVVNERLSR